MRLLAMLFACVVLLQPTYSQNAFPSGWQSSYGTGLTRPTDILMEDLNGDGFAEAIISTGWWGGASAGTKNTGVRLLMNEGGSYRGLVDYFYDVNFKPIPYGDFGDLRRHVFRDLNEDGAMDLLLEGRIRFNLPNQPANDPFVLDTTIVLGDFNHSFPVDLDLDGDLDIVCIAETYVAQFNNLGDWNLSEEIVIKENIDEGWYIQSADMNNDGYPDLVARWDNTLWWWSNNGSGSFGGGNNVENESSNDPFLLTDVDGDGYRDIVFAGNRVYLNNVGSYSGPTSYFSSSHSFLREMDLDGDGDLDVFSREGNGAWFERQADGSLANPVTLASAAGAAHCDMADVDGDGIDEMVVTRLSNGADRGYLFEQDGTLNFTQNIDEAFWNDAPWAMHADDLNGDGSDDMIMVAGDRLRWESLDRLPQPITPPDVFGTPATADLDGDGDRDVVFDHEGTLKWVANHGDGTFDYTLHELNASGIAEFFVQDMDGDFDEDIVYKNESGIYWLENNAGDWSTNHTLFEDANVSAWFNLSPGECNGDGYIDFGFEVDDDTETVHMLMSDGFGGYAPPALILTAYQSLTDFELLDFDSDGLDDVIYITYNGMQYSDPMGYMGYARSTGNGFEADEIVTMLSLSGSSSNWAVPVALHAGDMNLDGVEDLIVAHSWCAISRLDYYEFDGNEGIAFYRRISQSQPSLNCGVSLVIGDLDGDGAPDFQTAQGHVTHWVQNELLVGCMDPEACNYQPYYVASDSNDCCYGVCGCDDDDAINYEPTAECDDGSCTYIEGCTDWLASNYNPEATANNYDCEYGLFGCANPNAVNFSGAPVDDGSCEYLITGHVFNDESGDGNWSTSFEDGLPFVQVLVEPDSTLLITDDSGAFSILLPEGSHTFTTINHPNFPFSTTINPLEIDAGSLEDPLEIGLSAEEPMFTICVDFYPTNGGLCDAYQNFNICYRNMGNMTLDGVVEIEYDPLYQGYQEVTPIDSVVDNRIYMSFSGLDPGEMFFYDVELLTPTVDFIGQELMSVARIWGYANDQEVAFGSNSREDLVTCAYDPNDKQVYPLGYGDDHLLLGGTEQEFVVRFQNTGNAPAQNILIRDTLDAKWDLSTFQFVANSHSVQTSLDYSTRELTFFFPEIMLPDSNCCEPESHGLVSYKILPVAGLPAGNVLNNTAYIFFDNNPPIVTNTTWTTIHECNPDLEVSLEQTLACPYAEYTANTNYQEYPGLTTEYYWTGNEGLLGEESTLLLPDTYAGGIQLTVADPLCTSMASFDWESEGQAWVTCQGDVNCDGVVTTPDIQVMLGMYGCDGNCAFELDGDGDVSAQDLLIVLAAYGMACE